MEECDCPPGDRAARLAELDAMYREAAWNDRKNQEREEMFHNRQDARPMGGQVCTATVYAPASEGVPSPEFPDNRICGEPAVCYSNVMLFLPRCDAHRDNFTALTVSAVANPRS